MSIDVVELTKELITIPSTAGNPQALDEILERALSRLAHHSIQRFRRNGVPSALVFNTPQLPARFRTVLNGHLDIIPGKPHQQTPAIHGNRLYGVGAMDMKASVACLMAVFDEVASRVDYPLGLQLVTDEEIGGYDGTRYQIEQGVRADFVIVGECTGLDIEHQMKGILNLTVRTQGRTAHGAYPWLGENAIWQMHAFLERLRQRFPNPNAPAWVTTVNVSDIRTDNAAFNKVPDRCQADLNIRFPPGEGDGMIGAIEALLPPGADVEVLLQEAASFTDPDNPHLHRLASSIRRLTGRQPRLLSAHGTSDARHFAAVDCPAVEFGPVGGGMGSDEEWVDVESLKTYIRILRGYLLAQ